MSLKDTTRVLKFLLEIREMSITNITNNSSESEVENRIDNDSIGTVKGKIITIAAKLTDQSDSNEITHLFSVFKSLLVQNANLTRQNHDLKNQLVNSTPNYSKIQDDLEAKFEEYKVQLENENLQNLVAQQKIIHELVQKNENLVKENETLKIENKRLVEDIASLKATAITQSEEIETLKATSVTQSEKIDALIKKNEDICFQNYISDVFHYMREGIISKNTSATYPDGKDCLFHLYTEKELEDPKDEDYEDSEEDEKKKDIAEVTTKKVQWNDASSFITGMDLDPTLIRDLHKFNKDRNDDTHDEDCNLKTSRKITSPRNQAALKELKTVVDKIETGHASYFIKARLMAWLDRNIKSEITV